MSNSVGRLATREEILLESVMIATEDVVARKQKRNGCSAEHGP